MLTYTGTCHCKAVTFTFHSEPITGGMRCTCSMCKRRSAIMSRAYIKPDGFEITGGDALVCYRFEPAEVNHYFCGGCGIYVFHNAVDNPELGYRVNLGCIDEIDIYDLPLRTFDGADTWRYLDDDSSSR